MILALDCATKCGWCLLKDGKVYESGVEDFSKTRGESNGAMFLKFRAWLVQHIMDSCFISRPLGLIVYEQAHYRGGAATEIAVGLTTRVQEEAEAHKIPYATVHTGTLKKFATGSGAASKEKMMELAAVVLRRQPISDDEADAVHLAMWAFHEYGVK